MNMRHPGISLRVALLGLFTLIAVGGAGLVGLVSYSNARLAESEMASRLSAEMTLRITEHLRLFLELPQRIAECNARALQNGSLDSRNRDELCRRFADQIDTFPAISSVYFGSMQGGLIESGRSGHGDFRFSGLTDALAAGEYRRYAQRQDGTPDRVLEVVPGFDARIRPWYLRALALDGAAWSDPYKVFAGHELAMAASRPVRDRQGRLLGVVAVDVLLSQLTDFLQSLHIAHGGRAFVMDRTGQLIAASTPGVATVRGSDGGSARLFARDADDPLIRGAALVVEEHGQSAPGSLEFGTSSGTVLAQVAPLRDAAGLDWRVVVAVPAADLLSNIIFQNMITLELMAFCLLMALVVGWRMAGSILRPVALLDAAVARLAEEEDARLPEDASIFLEVRNLTRSFNRMAARLSASMAALRSELDERVQMGRALRVSEERYRAMVELAVDGIVLGDEDGRIIGVNACMCTMLGADAGDLIGRHVGELPFTESSLLAAPLRFDLLRQGQIVSSERALIRPDGVVITVEMRSRMMPDSTYQSIYRDITVRKNAESELLRHTALFRNLFERSPDAIAILDEHDRVMDVNQAFMTLFEYSLPQVLGVSINDLVARGPDCADAYEISESVFSELRIVERETLRSRRDGTLVEVVVTGYPIFVEGRLIGAFGIYRNITARKNAERELRDSTERFELAMRAARDGLYDWNLVDGTVYYSPSWKAMLGFRPDEVANELAECERLTHPDDLPHIKAVLDDYLEGRRDRYETEMRMRHKDGHWVAVLTRGTAVRDESGRVVRLVGTHLDLSEHKRIEADLLRAKEAAEGASRAKSEFLANMSHEIRTPLNGIMGMMQVLQDTSLDEEQRRCVQWSITSAGRLTQLLSDILDLSRIESGHMPVSNAPFAVRDLTDSVSDLFAVVARDKGLDLECRIESTVPVRLVGDEARVRQILFNLVGNSIKYTHVGRVRLELGIAEAQDGGLANVAFTVTDTGIGIPREWMSDIFEPFRQVEGSYTRHYQGAGLGLAIVRRLVRLLGGDLDMRSTVDVGTTVRVVLPFGVTGTAADRVPPVASTPVGADRFGPLRILVAEDDPMNRMAVAALLGKDGHSVVLAENGQEALNLLRDGDFDCVLMDVQMPVMSGVEATMHIRASGAAGAEVPIVALTAYAMTGDRERFLAAGMTDYLPKPVGMAELRAVLARVTRP